MYSEHLRNKLTKIKVRIPTAIAKNNSILIYYSIRSYVSDDDFFKT